MLAMGRAARLSSSSAGTSRWTGLTTCDGGCSELNILLLSEDLSCSLLNDGGLSVFNTLGDLKPSFEATWRTGMEIGSLFHVLTEFESPFVLNIAGILV